MLHADHYHLTGVRTMRIKLALAAACCVLATPAAGQQPAADHAEGKAVFDMVCAMCHSVTPPAKLAPPISHAAGFYAQRFADADSAVSAMVAYLKEPDAEKSLLPAHAVERYGLMQSQGHLSDAQLRAVARYVLTLSDMEHTRMHGQGNEQGHN